MIELDRYEFEACTDCYFAIHHLNEDPSEDWPGLDLPDVPDRYRDRKGAHVFWTDDRHRDCDRNGRWCEDCGGDGCGKCDLGWRTDPCPDSCEGDTEGGFSWARCDCCGSTLGGQRYSVVGLIWCDE